MDPTNILAILAILSAWVGFVEWRIRTMYNQLQEKIDDKEKLNSVIQNELKENVARLETKIDMLINLQLRQKQNDKD